MIAGRLPIPPLYSVLGFLIAICPVSSAGEKEDAAPLQPGDKVVTTGPTSVMDGSKLMGTLAAGTELPVRKVRGSWVGIPFEKGGGTITGWVQRKDVRLVTANPGPITTGKVVPPKEPEKGDDPATQEEPAARRIPDVARPRGEGWSYNSGTVLGKLEKEFGEKPYVTLEGGDVFFDVPGKKRILMTSFHVKIGFVCDGGGLVPPGVQKATKNLSEKLREKGKIALLRADGTEYRLQPEPHLYADCVEYWFSANGNQDDRNALVLSLPWGRLKLSRPR